MDQLIPRLAAVVAPLRDCFRIEVFQTFQALNADYRGGKVTLMIGS